MEGSPLSDAIDSIKSLGIRPNKALGQNFLIDGSAIEAIARYAASAGLPVIEIGAGLGAISFPIAKSGARIAAVELDERLASELCANPCFADSASCFVVNDDILKCNLADIHARLGGGDIAVCGNLPYYITSPICRRMILCGLPIRQMTLMMQTEAAERFLAKPSQPVYVPLSILYQYMYDIEVVMRLSKEAYYPTPEVSSVVLQLNRKETMLPERLEWLVRTAFSMRRKTLLNNLTAAGITKDDAIALIDSAGLPRSIRAEAVSVSQFVLMAEALNR